MLIIIVNLYKIPRHKIIIYDCSIKTSDNKILYTGTGELTLTIYPKIITDNYYKSVLTVDDISIPLQSDYPATFLSNFYYLKNKLTRKNIFLYQTTFLDRFIEESRIELSRNFTKISGYSNSLNFKYGEKVDLQGVKQ